MTRPNPHNSKLTKMFREMTSRVVKDVEDPAWVSQVLDRGALVAMRINPHTEGGRRELRIARAEKPKDAQAQAKWEREVKVFLNHFGIHPVDGDEPCQFDAKEWLWLEPDLGTEDEPGLDRGKAVVRLLELRTGEVKPGVAVCWDCLHDTGELVEVPWFPSSPKQQLCNRHKLERGRQELEGHDPSREQPQLFGEGVDE